MQGCAKLDRRVGDAGGQRARRGKRTLGPSLPTNRLPSSFLHFGMLSYSGGYWLFSFSIHVLCLRGTVLQSLLLQ